MIQNISESTAVAHQQQIKELREIEKEVYDELMRPSLGLQVSLYSIFAVLAITTPLQVFFEDLVGGIPPLQINQLSIPFELAYFAVPVLSLILMAYSNIKFVAAFDDRLKLFKFIQAELERNGAKSDLIVVTEVTQQYKLVLRIETAFVGATFFVACLWFLFPDQARLEPLSLIYAAGTAVFEYFRTELRIPNPLSRYIANRNRS